MSDPKAMQVAAEVRALYAQGLCAVVVLVGNPKGHLAPRWPLRLTGVCARNVAATVADALAIAGAL